MSADQILFDEAWYLATYSDVAAAVSGGLLPSGRAHYDRVGRAQGRLPCPLDDHFYRTRYPLVNPELASGALQNPAAHFRARGSARGYLAAATAPRPANAHSARSPFGGLWTDSTHAVDLIVGRHEIGILTDDEAKRLLAFIEMGFMVLPAAIPAQTLDAAEAALDSAYGGGEPGLLFECHALAPAPVVWHDMVRSQTAKALDLHALNPAIRDLIFSPRLVRMLSLLFECRPLASQSLAFWNGSGQQPHQDSAYVAYSLPREFAASWIALEDVSAGAGELFYYPGSHRLPEYSYQGFKSVSEARRAGIGETELQGLMDDHVRQLEHRLTALGIKRETFLARRGDILIWHADLVHGGSPISRHHTRKSVVTHYCPRFNIPLYAETRAINLHRHGDGYYMSGVY